MMLPCKLCCTNHIDTDLKPTCLEYKATKQSLNIMMADNVFAYLGDIILNSTLQDFSRLKNTHFSGQVQNDPVLKSQLEKFSHRADCWPEEVVKSFRNWEAPCYTQNRWSKSIQIKVSSMILI